MSKLKSLTRLQTGDPNLDRLQDHYREVLTPVMRVFGNDGRFQQDAWVAPTLLNSWVNFGAGGQPAGYCKDSQGFVRLKGLVKSGTPGATSVIFTLPAGYRPANNSHHAVPSNALFGFCRVDSSGSVIAYAGSGTWFALDGISFDTR